MMPDDAKQAWSEVGEKFSSFGHRVAERYREGTPETGAADEESQRELRRAAEDVIAELSRGFSAIGATLRDEQAKQELTGAVSAIGDAITATVNEATEGLRSGSSKAPGDDETDGRAG